MRDYALTSLDTSVLKNERKEVARLFATLLDLILLYNERKEVARVCANFTWSDSARVLLDFDHVSVAVCNW